MNRFLHILPHQPALENIGSSKISYQNSKSPCLNHTKHQHPQPQPPKNTSLFWVHPNSLGGESGSNPCGDAEDRRPNAWREGRYREAIGGAMSGIQVNLLKLVMELIIYSEGQSLRTPFGKKQGSCISVYMYAYMSARQTSDILEQLHQDIDTWYYHETLRNDRGDTKNDDFWYTCLPDFITTIKCSGTMRDTQKTMTMSATSFREM